MQAPRTHRRHPRTAFTIVELLVSMALILFIMVILSEAFVQSVAAFSQLKAAGDLQERLRGAATIIRQDLQAPHFQGQAQTNSQESGTRLSSWDMRTFTPPDGLHGWGFFRIWEGTDSETGADSTEGADDVLNAGTPPAIPPPPVGIPSSRAQNHILHFTAQLPGVRPEGYFTGRVPTGSPLQAMGPAPYQANNVYHDQWAEIAYFLRPTGELAGQTPLYALFRRQKVAMTPGPGKTSLNSGTTSPPRQPYSLLGSYLDLSCEGDPPPTPTNLYFNGPDDLTVPERRMFANPIDNPAAAPPEGGGLQYPFNGTFAPWYQSLADPGQLGPTSLQSGDDLLLQDVISFEVKALYDTNGNLTRPDGSTTALGYEFQLFPYCTLNAAYAPYNLRVFDTWTSTATDPYAPYQQYATQWNQPNKIWTIPLQVRVRALQISIRVWDKKTQQARQVTIVQDM